MYSTFHYLTISCVPAIGHVYDISILDSFIYTCYRSCIWRFSTWQFQVHLHAIGYVRNISRYDTRHLLIVADILWWVRYLKFILNCSWHFAACLPSKVPDIVCRWHFMVSYLGKVPITSMYNFYWQKFYVTNWILLSLVRPPWFWGL